MQRYRETEDMNAPGIKEIYSQLQNSLNDWTTRHSGNIKIKKG